MKGSRLGLPAVSSTGDITGHVKTGEVYYDAKVALWECGAPEQPESQEWFKIHIRKTPGRAGDMYTGEISCKDEDGLKQFVNDHEGFIFVEEDSQEMVMLCFQQSVIYLSRGKGEKQDPSVIGGGTKGEKRERKIVKIIKPYDPIQIINPQHQRNAPLLPPTCGRGNKGISSMVGDGFVVAYEKRWNMVYLTLCFL